MNLRYTAFWYNLSVGKILQKKKRGKLQRHLPGKRNDVCFLLGEEGKKRRLARFSQNRLPQKQKILILFGTIPHPSL